MLNKNYVFKVLGCDKEMNFEEIDSTEDVSAIDNFILIFEGKVYNKETKTFDKITQILREDTERNRKKFEIASKKYKEVSQELIDEYLPTVWSPFHCDDDIVCPEFKMVYEDTECEKFLSKWFFEKTFSPDEIVTIKTKTDTFKNKITGIKTLGTYSRKIDPYKLVIDVQKNILNIINYKAGFSVRKDTLEVDESAEMLSLNMDTGLTYLFKNLNPKTKTSSDIKNVTTGNILIYDFSASLDDTIVDKVIEIIQEYWQEKYGTRPTCTKLKVPLDTIRSFNFNPNCNVLYNYKSFFNTRFRTYFKRSDATNHFEELCKLVGIPYDESFLELAASNKNELFLAKCLYDAGIKKIENIKSVINTLKTYYDNPSVKRYSTYWTENITGRFIDKFYGDNTDYLYREDYCSKNSIEDFCTYIKTAIPYTSEDEFVAMFNRSFIANNKYWCRSLFQVATLIELNDYSRELMRKACSYGLNKIQSDNIDLAYDKAITKNKFITYTADEMEAECTISKCTFKFPIETYENAALFGIFNSDQSKISQESLNVARKRCNIIYVKDKSGEVVGYMKYRGIFLLEAKFTKGTTKVSAEEARIACIEWCDRFGIKQYRCDDLKAKEETRYIPF